jgi:NADPH:quinone reductase-like Zn-dependent oxidoreductase
MEIAMKTIVCTEYGPTDDVLEFKEVEKPALKEDEVLAKVQAASVDYPNWGLLREVFFVRLKGQGLLQQKNFNTRI